MIIVSWMDHFWWAYERVNLDSKTRKLAKSLSEVGFLDEMLKDKYFSIDIHLVTWSNGLSYVDLNSSVWRPIKKTIASRDFDYQTCKQELLKSMDSQDKHFIWSVLVQFSLSGLSEWRFRFYKAVDEILRRIYESRVTICYDSELEILLNCWKVHLIRFKRVDAEFRDSKMCR